MALLIAEDSKQVPASPDSSHMLGAPAHNHLSVPPLGSFQFVGTSFQGAPNWIQYSRCDLTSAKQRGLLTEDSVLSLCLQILSLLLHEVSIVIIAGISADSACQLCLPII